RKPPAFPEVDDETNAAMARIVGKFHPFKPVTRAQDSTSRGGKIASAKKRAKTEEQIAAAEKQLRQAGKRGTNKQIAKEIGRKHPDYVGRVRRRMRKQTSAS